MFKRRIYPGRRGQEVHCPAWGESRCRTPANRSIRKDQAIDQRSLILNDPRRLCKNADPCGHGRTTNRMFIHRITFADDRAGRSGVATPWREEVAPRRDRADDHAVGRRTGRVKDGRVGPVLPVASRDGSAASEPGPRDQGPRQYQCGVRQDRTARTETVGRLVEGKCR